MRPSNDISRLRNLHTLTRRYCMNRTEHWRQVYSAMPERPLFGDYSAEQYRTFPRYNVLDAILEGVEALVPEDFKEVESLRAKLIEAGATDNLMTRPPHNVIEQEAIDDERATFVRYVESIRESDLRDVEPLFYRRTLRSEEISSFWSRLDERWTKPGLFYPLNEKPEGVDVEAFHVSIFANEVGYRWLSDRLLQRGLTRVFELDEGGASGREIDLAFAEQPEYGASGGLEIWWTDENVSFVIYASHESSIMFG